MPKREGGPCRRVGLRRNNKHRERCVRKGGHLDRGGGKTPSRWDVTKRENIGLRRYSEGSKRHVRVSVNVPRQGLSIPRTPTKKGKWWHLPGVRPYQTGPGVTAGPCRWDTCVRIILEKESPSEGAKTRTMEADSEIIRPLSSLSPIERKQ